MQCIYTYIPERNYVPRECGVATILLLLFMVLISLVSVLNLLYFYISRARNTCAVPNMAFFCKSSTSWFPRILLTYFLNDFEIVPVALIVNAFISSYKQSQRTFTFICIKLYIKPFLVCVYFVLWPFLCSHGTIKDLYITCSISEGF